MGTQVYSAARLFEIQARRAFEKEESSAETDKVKCSRISALSPLPTHGQMLWTKLNPRIWFSSTRTAVQTMPTINHPAVSHRAVATALDRMGNCQFHDQELPPLASSQIILPTPRRDQNPVLLGQRVSMLKLLPSQRMANLPPLCLKRFRSQCLQRRCQLLHYTRHKIRNLLRLALRREVALCHTYSICQMSRLQSQRYLLVAFARRKSHPWTQYLVKTLNSCRRLCRGI